MAENLVARLDACVSTIRAKAGGFQPKLGDVIRRSGAGYMAEYPVERFYRDVRLFRIFEGTTQIQQLVIARELLKAAD